MKLSTLSEWISWIDSLHHTEIDLGLERVKQVAERLEVLKPNCPVIMVAGTNGKGSTVTTLESIYRAAKYRTATFTSPYLFKPNEQVRINQEMATDDALCEAFEKVERARETISLTPFEFFTLATFVIFKSQQLDIMILEIGLGGRLDAVNILDADVSIITSIDIDHVNYLGNTREQIGFEKAGIFKPNTLAICGDQQPPNAVLDQAKKLAIPLYIQEQAFGYEEWNAEWSWWSEFKTYEHVPRNQLNIENMSTVLMAITLLQNRLSVTEDEMIKGLMSVTMIGRVQIIAEPVTKIFDVSHNPHAITYLKKCLMPYKQKGKLHAVFSMLSDKDVMTCIEIMKDQMEDWFVAPLVCKRAMPLVGLEAAFKKAGVQNVKYFETITEAYDEAVGEAKEGESIVVFGSFHTVAEVMNYL